MDRRFLNFNKTNKIRLKIQEKEPWNSFSNCYKSDFTPFYLYLNAFLENQQLLICKMFG